MIRSDVPHPHDKLFDTNAHRRAGWGIYFEAVPDRDDVDICTILCSGRSARLANLKLLEGTCTTITVNNSWRGYPEASYWLTSDPWGISINNPSQLPPENECSSELYAVVHQQFGTNYAPNPAWKKQPDPRVHCIMRHVESNISQAASQTFSFGLIEDRRILASGNSGYSALNFAYLLKPKRIILLGCDGQQNGYFYKAKTGDPKQGQLKDMRKMFYSAKKQLDDAGIEVVNLSNETVIDFFKTDHPKNLNKYLELA